MNDRLTLHVHLLAHFEALNAIIARSLSRAKAAAATNSRNFIVGFEHLEGARIRMAMQGSRAKQVEPFVLLEAVGIPPR